MRDHPGPTKEHMPISWTSSMGHAWNTKVIQLLAAEFKENVKACLYQKMTTLPNDRNGQYSVFNIIQRKLSSHQATLQKISRKRMMAGHLSQLEFAEMMSNEKTAVGLRKRRIERKKNVSHLRFRDSLLKADRTTQLWIRRAEIIMEAIDSPDKEAELWGEIQQVFDHLEVHDMSSDETETEADFSAAKTVRRIRKYWINEDISKVRDAPVH